MRVLFAASEAFPFFSTGKLGEVTGCLPAALRLQGIDVRGVLPLHGELPAGLRNNLKFITSFTVPVNWQNPYCGLYSLVQKGITWYFLDNEYYFQRDALYNFHDDGERYAFFARGLLEVIKYIDFTPDIIHCNDWHTALSPVYLHIFYRDIDQYKNIKAIFTIHDIKYQGIYSPESLIWTIGIQRNEFHIVEYDGVINYMKGAIETADRVNTVSPSYALEILEPGRGHGLDGFLRQRAYKLRGILSGIDVDNYDPSLDPALVLPYTESTLEEGKAACKRRLREIFGLEDGDGPLLGLVTRFAGHKGLDILLHAAEELVDAGMQIVLLGHGDSSHKQAFAEFAARRRGRFGLRFGFLPRLARKIYAGCDMFLMPSKEEPCGIASMVALRYGTVPIVRETGGLKDIVVDCGKGAGNGFTFPFYSAFDLQMCCLRAQKVYQDKKLWNELARDAMRRDHSWRAPSGQYKEMYEETLALW
jgi:starch synthase